MKCYQSESIKRKSTEDETFNDTRWYRDNWVSAHKVETRHPALPINDWSVIWHASQSTHILAGIVSILLIGFNKSVIYDQHSSDSSTIWTGFSH